VRDKSGNSLRTGILGGTFNPIHNGHLRSAEEAREILNLDRIIFIPCYLPPHKGENDVASPSARVKMLELAIEGNEHFEISDMEIKREGKSYSFETLGELNRLYGKEEELFFIIGTDSFIELGTWKDYEKLFSMVNFVVVARPGYVDSPKDSSPATRLPVEIRADFCYDSQLRLLKHKSGRATHFLETTLLDISSTKMREDISENRSVKYLLPAKVERFIEEKGLFKDIR
jgi:nicotinate-nucleotide adenylyltransferase